MFAINLLEKLLGLQKQSVEQHFVDTLSFGYKLTYEVSGGTQKLHYCTFMMSWLETSTSIYEEVPLIKTYKISKYSRILTQYMFNQLAN